MIQHALHGSSYLDCAKFYHKVWETPSIKADTADKGKAVGAVGSDWRHRFSLHFRLLRTSSTTWSWPRTITSSRTCCTGYSTTRHWPSLTSNSRFTCQRPWTTANGGTQQPRQVLHDYRIDALARHPGHLRLPLADNNRLQGQEAVGGPPLTSGRACQCAEPYIPNVL
jgi:hypothetical protein